MIDLENDIYDYVVKRLTSEHTNVNCSKEYEETLSEFPAVTITEASNRVVNNMRTDVIENAVTVMYEANIYSNRVSGWEAQAKSIAGTLDDIFLSIGFTRIFMNRIPNRDTRIYRITCRYEAIIGPAQESGKYLIYHSR